MFDSEDEGQQKTGGFKINRKFEKSFNERKTREDLEWAKGRYGRNMEQLGDDGSDSSLAEDEDAILDNENVTLKVLNTISKIRNKNPEIYDHSKVFFEEKDLASGLSQLEKGKMLGKRADPFTYRKQVQRMVADIDEGEAMSEEEEADPVDETPFEVQQRFKSEFKQAAAFDAADTGDDNDDENLFTVKKKSKKQVEDEEAEFKKFLSLQKKSDRSAAKDLKKTFGDKSALDEGDQFLRKFILTKGWVEVSEDEGTGDFGHFDGGKHKAGYDEELALADEEDEQREEEMEKFEEKINFRFERPGGTKVQTYEREVKETMRKKDETRADKRKEREQRKKEEREEFKSEVEHFKSLKKAELQNKIQKLLKAGGFADMDKATSLQNIVNNDFDEKEYDKQMEKVFNEDYYDDADENEDELMKYIEEAEEKVDAAITGIEKEGAEDRTKQTSEDPELATLQPTTNLPILMKKKINKEEAEAIQESLKDNLWWYCDSCGRGIQPLESRFDCMECEDYTECKQCAELKGHDHKMKKFIVPEGKLC